ncbi:general transcriptional repressor [Moniliophthora roreri]|nr:general transcriptional repressor [Moniliophthora roreri]
MNQHCSLQPTGTSAQPSPATHLNESFEVIRQEFDLLAQEVTASRNQHGNCEAKVTSQVNELNIICQSIYELKAQHGKV